MDFQDYKGRCAAGSLYGSASDLSGDWFVSDDPDDHSQSAYRWSGKGLGCLKALKIPVHEIAMMMSIALRFIPILVEETDKIMKAQMARGADFETGNIIRKAKAMVPLLVPLFISAFRRATDLAMAMEARCYQGGEGRTKMKPPCSTAREIMTLT